ncbi:hypothetical protein PHLGIDRAFT_75695 [Phlebiopsis gigantea 11061_1 CR5-6]|uniref:C2 domain-containing protein n=1 Tax=Phlebiopsis gigantea (strain 11061_1 CR5-6) TaxID=745531 RepID=A0A0C3NI72_PHLG1|nr:hypothetical protein PHLGIDRAFT_75695 [Phlebiopsis gigantea 11061_1 CR5-6]
MKYVDVAIQFIGASGIPKMDVVGTADPYFIAKLDDRVKYVSTVQVNTLSPVWNEYWKIKNVPTTARLSVEVMDKDDGTITDDIVGTFSTTMSPGPKEFAIESPSLRRNRGTFWLKIESTPSTGTKPEMRPYIFDGPIRFSRHYSPTVGRLTNLDDARLYSTWKMFLRGVRLFFSDDEKQHWNRDYKAAQTIFQGPASIAVRSTIQAGHRMLYARTTSNGFGVINEPKDVMTLLHGGSAGTPHAHRVKPAVYTYVLAVDDDSFRFSETGAAFFVDFASKHALHANCAEAVRYSGEFHPRPACGWAAFSDATPDDQVGWELVIDNNSGTYSPSPLLLPNLKELLEYNFPGFGICAYDHNDPRLSESRDACRAYALAHRGVRQEELQPHTHGEESLAHNASVHAPDASVHSELAGRMA